MDTIVFHPVAGIPEDRIPWETPFKNAGRKHLLAAVRANLWVAEALRDALDAAGVSKVSDLTDRDARLILSGLGCSGGGGELQQPPLPRKAAARAKRERSVRMRVLMRGGVLTGDCVLFHYGAYQWSELTEAQLAEAAAQPGEWFIELVNRTPRDDLQAWRRSKHLAAVEALQPAHAALIRRYPTVAGVGTVAELTTTQLIAIQDES